MTGSSNDFISKINKSYKCDMIRVGGKFGAINIPRISSGVLSVDLAVGGGWPFGKIVTIGGDESTGKTLLALKACAEVENYDHLTKKHKSQVEPMRFVKGKALLVDSEGAFEEEWAEAQGFDTEWHVVARPEYSEQAVDIVSMALQENIFDLIIVDSIAAMTPAKEIEESAEKAQMGIAAQINNKAYRKWLATLVKLSQTNQTGPCLMCLNNLRVEFGVLFGDPRCLVGGRQQKFASSIVIYTQPAKYGDTDEKESGIVELRGVTKKNKTFPPRRNYSFNLILKDHADYKTGDIDNIDQLVFCGKKYRILTKKGGKWMFGDKEFANEDAIKNRLRHSETLFDLMWRSVISAATK